MRKCGKCRLEGHINTKQNPCQNMIINEQSIDTSDISTSTTTSTASQTETQTETPVQSVSLQINHNEDIANMKLKHPYYTRRFLNESMCTYLSNRKILSDDKLSLVIQRENILIDKDGIPMENGYIYIKRIPNIQAQSRIQDIWNNEWTTFQGYGPGSPNRDIIENTLITVWIFEGRSPGIEGFESYTKIKGYQKFCTCSCFISIKIESQSYHYILNGS